ncbi:hypothetical protein AHAT_23060 [Agarivorans sp. Toyoura001]|nr:hypothetical protein AHAT_23060 [Agarivorans sp. Toyoura001]
MPTTKHIKKGPNGYPKGAVFRDFIGIKTGHKMLRNEMVDFVNAANKMCDDYVVLFRTISELENCRIYFNNLDDPWTLMHNK